MNYSTIPSTTRKTRKHETKKRVVKSVVRKAYPDDLVDLYSQWFDKGKTTFKEFCNSLYCHPDEIRMHLKALGVYRGKK